MIIKDIKLCPSKISNCHLVNSDQNLLDKFNKLPIQVLENESDDNIFFV